MARVLEFRCQLIFRPEILTKNERLQIFQSDKFLSGIVDDIRILQELLLEFWSEIQMASAMIFNSLFQCAAGVAYEIPCQKGLSYAKQTAFFIFFKN